MSYYKRKQSSDEKKKVSKALASKKERRKLRDFPLVVKSLDEVAETMLIDLHFLLYFSSADSDKLTDNILDFDGFKFTADSEEYDERNDFLERMSGKLLVDVARAFCLGVSSKREETTQNILSFLMKPDESYLRTSVNIPVIFSDEELDVEGFSDSEEFITSEVVEKKVESIDLFKNPKKVKSKIHHCPVSGCLYSLASGSEKFFTEKKLLNQHIAEVHAKKKFSCSKCQLSFDKENYKKFHEKTCSTQWKCPDCLGTYLSQESLLTHAKKTKHKLPDHLFNDKMPKELAARKGARFSIGNLPKTATVEDNLSPVQLTSSVTNDPERNVVQCNETSIAPVVSTAAIPTGRVLRPRPRPETQPKYNFAQYNVSTQTNFEELTFSETTKENKRLEPKSAFITGRRIIDFTYFLQALKYVNNHSENCNLSDIFVEKEDINGLCTSYVLKCAVCNFRTIISSDLPSKELNNHQLVLIMMKLKCSYKFMKKLLTTMDLPVITYADFIKERDKISLVKKNKIPKCTYKLMKKLLTTMGLPAVTHADFIRERNKISLLNKNMKTDKKIPKCTYKFMKKLLTKMGLPAITHADFIRERNKILLLDENKKTHKNSPKDLKKNTQKFDEIPMQESISSHSDNNLFEEVDLGNLLIDDQFEIKKGNALKSESESVAVVPLQPMRTHEDRVTVNEDHIKLDNKEAKRKLYSVDDYERINKKRISFCSEEKFETMTNPQKTFAENEESRRILHTDKINNRVPVIQGIPTTVTSKDKNLFQNKSEPNITVPSSTTTCGENTVAPSPKTTDRGKVYLVPVDHKFKSPRYDALIIPQTYKDQEVSDYSRQDTLLTALPECSVPNIPMSTFGTDVILDVNDNSRQDTLPTALPGGSVPNIPVSTVGTDAISKVNDNNRQGTLPIALSGSSMPNIPMSAVGTETGVFLVQDTMMAETAAHIGSPNKLSSCVSPVSSPVEIIYVIDGEALGQENVQQMTPDLQNSFNSFSASRHLSNISMQVNPALYRFSDGQYSAINAEVPSHLSDSQEVMRYADSNWSILGMSDLNLPANTEKAFQMPSMSFPTQAQQHYKHNLPIEHNVMYGNDNEMPTFSNLPSAIETKKKTRKKCIRRRRCNECPGCQTKTNCGMCSHCNNFLSRKICKLRKCEQLKTKV